MITLHRLNGDEFYLHAQHIESVEQNPDTRITMVNGKQLYVRESPDDVRRSMLRWYRGIHAPMPHQQTTERGR